MNSQTSASDALRDSLSVGPQSSSEPRDKPEARAADQKFQYDERIAGAIIPAMLVFATMAEPAVLGMLVVGLLVAYMLDTSRQKELALAAVWITFALAGVTDSIAILASGRHSQVGLCLAVIFTSLSLLCLAGLWASLQFRFLPLRYPVLAHAAENILITATPPTAASLLTVAAVAYAEAAAAPYYSACVCWILTAAFVPPLTPSFRTRGRATASRPTLGGAESPVATFGAPSATIQSAGQAGVISMTLAALPVLLYVGTNFRHMHEEEHLWSLALLICGPIMFFHLCPKALWWFPRELYGARMVAWGLSFLIGVAAIERRVVAVAFGAYVKLHAPWSWIVVTAGLYLGAALVIAYFAGLIPLMDPGLVGVICIAVCTAGGLSLGLPLYILPFALFAGAGLALYQESESPVLYLAFVVGMAVCGGHFLYTNFWFLDIMVGDVPLQAVLITAGLSFVPALLLPALMRSSGKTLSPGDPENVERVWMNMLLLNQANMTTTMEELMFTGENGQSYYPPYLVIATSVMGVILARYLKQQRLIQWGAYHFMCCLNIGKVFMLVMPEARMGLPVAMLLLVGAPPLTVPLRDGYFDLSRDGGFPDPSRKIGPAETSPMGTARKKVIKTMAAVVLFGFQVMHVGFVRLAVFDAVAAVWGGPPPEGVLLCALLVTAAATFSPLVYTWYPNSTFLKQCVFLLLAAAATLGTVRPPVPIAGGAKCPRTPFKLCPRLWDERHVPAHEVDDVLLYGEGLVWREHWALWLLVASVALAGASATSIGGGNRRALGRQLVLALLSALSAGYYLAFEFLPDQKLVQTFVVAGTLCAAALLVLMNSPALLQSASATPSHLALLPVAWTFFFGLALALQTIVPLPPLPPEASRLMPDMTRAQVDSERRTLAQAAVAAIFAAQGFLVALALKLRITVASAPLGSASGPGGARAQGGALGRGSGAVRRVRAGTAAYASGAGAEGRLGGGAGGAALLSSFVDQRLLDAGGKMMRLDAAGNAAQARLAAAGLSWMPPFANVIVLITFGLAVMLNFTVAEGKDEAILMLAPLLLLLNQDPYLLPMLDDRRRYCPPYLALVVYLFGSALRAAFAASTRHSSVAAMAALASILCAMPNHALFAAYLWNQKRQSEWMLLFFTPLNAIPALFGVGSAIWWLCGGGVFVALAQGVAMRQVRRMGTRLI